MRRTLLRLLAVSSLAVAVATASAATGAPPRPNFDVSAASANEAEHAIAADPLARDHVVAMSTLADAKSGLFEGITSDGGKTWTRSVIGQGDALGQVCCDEQLAWDRFGNLWMVYLTNTDGNVHVALSTDSGRMFAPVAEIVPPSPPGGSTATGPSKGASPDAPTPSADQPSVSVGSDSVWVSWQRFPSKVVQAAGARVTGRGRFGDFSEPESVPGPEGIGGYGDTAVGPDGQVMVSYQRAGGGEHGTRIFTAVDPDGFGSAGFETPHFLTWSNVGGFDYIPAQPDRSVDAEPNLAWDRSGGAHTGRVYAIWVQEKPDESNNTDVMLQYSNDDGATWTKAVKLNDDATLNSQFNPAIALDQTTGDVAVSWYDARRDVGHWGLADTDGIPNDDVQIWATYTTDGGAKFVPNFRVSAGTSNIPDAGSNFDSGDYTHAAFVDHVFYPAWSDNSNSTGENPDGTLHQLDLFTARVVIP